MSNIFSDNQDKTVYIIVYAIYSSLKCSTELSKDVTLTVTLFSQVDACIQDLVRCVALTRLVYGEGHLKVAQAHVRLAKAYFQLKGHF